MIKVTFEEQQIKEKWQTKKAQRSNDFCAFLNASFIFLKFLY
jgi:hypothetical protein